MRVASKDHGNSLPTHSKAPCRIDEPSGIGGETTGNGEDDGELAQRVNGRVQHETDQGEANQQRRGTSGGQRLSGTDEETSSDGTTDGNHLQMTALEFSAKRRVGNVVRRQFEVDMSGSCCSLLLSLRAHLVRVLSE